MIAYNRGVRLFPVCVVAFMLASAPALAFEGYSGTRVMGTGGASRAWALGDAGPLLNPSGMSIVKSYVVEGGYTYGRRLEENFLHASVVDGTSTFNIAGGLYYTYHHIAPPGTTGQSHEGGGALSLPMGDHVAIGATVKYFRFMEADAIGDRRGGFTFDLGATVRPIPLLSFALTGTNLYGLDNGYAPKGVGYGAALLAGPVAVVADGRTSFTADNFTGRKGTSGMLGAEWTATPRLGLRVGGGYDAATKSGYLTAGVSGISDIGAFDAGIRQDLFVTSGLVGVGGPDTNNTRQTMLGVGLRLFVPAQQTQPPLMNGL